MDGYLAMLSVSLKECRRAWQTLGTWGPSDGESRGDPESPEGGGRSPKVGSEGCSKLVGPEGYTGWGGFSCPTN